MSNENGAPFSFLFEGRYSHARHGSGEDRRFSAPHRGFSRRRCSGGGVQTGAEPQLTVYIDRAGGIDLDACEAFHNAIDAPLDELDPTYGAPYTLNISSLGLDRPFRKAADFEKNIGEEVEVKLYASVRGKKYWEGILLSYDGEAIRLRAGKETFTLELKQIAKINKAIHFE